MTVRGHQFFVDELARFAGEGADATSAELLTQIAARVAAPLRVAVRGRPAVGGRTVARALAGAGRAAGLSVTTARGPAADCDVLVHVIAEVIKPEDSRELAAFAEAVPGCPVLVVLNKADLCGFGGAGPIAAAKDRCRQFSELLGIAVEPMSGLLAAAALDLQGDDGAAGLWAALEALARQPGAARSLDGSYPAFLGLETGPEAGTLAQRRLLLETLDLFGTALAIAAVQRRNGAAQVGAMLRRVSRVDAVVGKVAALGAELRYRRVLDAVTELEALAASWGAGEPRGEWIGDFLSRDDTVMARMAAAVELAEALGLTTEMEDAGGGGGHLPRAARWRRYSRGQVSDLHRACGADIARGSLRLWSRAGGSL